MWYKASADGAAMSPAYTPAPVEIERPAVIDVWYEKGIEGKPLRIHATTNLDMQYLYLYLENDQIGSWDAGEAEIIEYATCKEWVVEHTFVDPGAYYLWYKASENGTEMSLPYAPAAVQIERPAVIEVWYEKGLENTPLKIHVTSNLQMQYLYLYLGENLLESWKVEDAEIVEYATCKEWIIEHTFADPGAYYLWYKASEDGRELSQAYAPAAVQIERPAIIEVWYEDAVTDAPVTIHSTTNLDMQYLYLYLGENLLQEWQAKEVEIVDYATCKEWTVEYMFKDAGAYYLWYKASKDGTTEELPFAPAPLYVEKDGENPEATTTPEPKPTPEPTPSPTVFSALVTCDAKESFVGRTVVWNATAVNGIGPYKYLFKLYQDGKLLKTREYSDDPTYAYSFAEAGEYYVVLSIKDDNSEVASTQSNAITVGLEEPIVSEILCDLESIQTTETATWSAAATGGQAPYNFRFVLSKEEETVAEQTYSDVTTFFFEFTDEGDYALSVTVKDDLGTESETYELAVSVALRPIEITSLTASAVSAQTEEAITWTVEAFAGKAPYTYAFEVVVDGVSRGKSEEQTEKTYSYIPELAGAYQVIAYVTDAYGNVAQLESGVLAVTPKPLAICTVTADKDWVKLGDTVTWMTTAIGGVEPLCYAFTIHVNGEEVDGGIFSPNNTISYAPEMAGTYCVNALVRDAENTTVSIIGGEVIAYMQITVDSVTADVRECMTGEPVTWTANIIGGKGELSYYYEVYCGNTLEYATNSSRNTLSYTPTHSGAYMVKAYATDENGESSELIGGKITVFQYNSSPVEDFVFNTLNEGYCEIIGYTGTDAAIVLPDMDSNGRIVQGIASYAFDGNANISSIVMPESIEYVRSFAFNRCTGLLAVRMSDSITTLGERVFNGCSKLNSINYPMSWTEATSYSAFYDCISLKSIVVPEGVTSIPAYAFYCANNLTTIELPSTLETIGDYAFFECKGLKSIDMSGGLMKIDAYAFSGCTGLTSVVIPDSVTEIGDGAFSGCTGLTTANVSKAITVINAGIFKGCTGLIRVE